ncbi:TMV resistance protein N-like [Eucalyptus grandis]|uniref:TMV resistance protein N-like n=1 Tax=Eucalyptus grandis TaxID=71139 RepID=UPI00192E7C7A|nr:TMV resistance protein N-like [Eucalyptus grandis]
MYAFANVLLALLLIYACKIVPKKTGAVPQNYDVFLSFRGEDTRTGFTDFLYISLVDAGFHVFRDNDALPVGKEIGSELLQAIRNCQIAIPIISERYAQSKPCLHELNEIMDCHTKHHRSVFPVFYKVDVVDVLEQRGIFGKALREHRRHCSSRDVQNWELALTSVAGIRGWTSQAIANGHEGELVKMVVAKVSSVLKTRWIERLLIFSMLMSYYRIRSGISPFRLSPAPPIPKYSLCLS